MRGGRELWKNAKRSNPASFSGKGWRAWVGFWQAVPRFLSAMEMGLQIRAGLDHLLLRSPSDGAQVGALDVGPVTCCIT